MIWFKWLQLLVARDNIITLQKAVDVQYHLDSERVGPFIKSYTFQICKELFKYVANNYQYIWIIHQAVARLNPGTISIHNMLYKVF